MSSNVIAPASPNGGNGLDVPNSDQKLVKKPDTKPRMLYVSIAESSCTCVKLVLVEQISSHSARFLLRGLHDIILY